ncbi:MAG TPA: polysaccharide deacetylase family protein [Terriglobales bacterium]|nr:polysaccharide deacetylase family protein [Terriglobales bacterium]
MKRFIKNFLISGGVTKLAARLARPCAAVLMYHSVLDDPSDVKDTLGGIAHSTDLFRKQMELIAREYNPVSLEDVSLFLKGKKELPRRAVAITFDDGYTDNLEVAVPILNALGLSATFYVAVDCVEKRTLPWVAKLRWAFYRSNKSFWANGKGKLNLATFEERDRAFLEACDECCQLAGEGQQRFVEKIELQLETELPANSARLIMSWEQVRELLRRGHIVGSHTMTHPNMAYVSDSELKVEFAESKRRLEEQLSIPIVHFAYPCPAMSPCWIERTVKASREAGYETAVTVTNGPVRRGNDPLSLRRVMPTKRVDGLRWNLERTFAHPRYAW